MPRRQTRLWLSLDHVGRGRPSTIAYITLKVAALAPMPSASDSTTTAVPWTASQHADGIAETTQQIVEQIYP